MFIGPNLGLGILMPAVLVMSFMPVVAGVYLALKLSAQRPR